MEQRTYGVFADIPLPDAVEDAASEFDGDTVPHIFGDIVQNAITQIDRIIESEHQAAGFIAPGVIGKHPFPAETGLTIFAIRIGRVGFHGSAAAGRTVAVDVSGGEGDDAGFWKPFADFSGEQHVGRPGVRLIFIGPEFSSRQKENVVHFRQGVQLLRIQQIGFYNLHAPMTHGLCGGWVVKL